MKASDRLKLLAARIDKILPTLANQGKFNFLAYGKESIAAIIKRRTRLGRGVSESGELDKLRPLSPNYVKARKKMRLSGSARPNKSNLTQTGEMLDNIQGKRSGTLFTFFFKGSDNQDKAKWAREGGRPFFDLSTTERNGITRKIAKVIRDALRKTFKA